MCLSLLWGADAYAQEHNAQKAPELFEAGINVIFRKDDFNDTEELNWKLDALFDRLYHLNINSISITWLIYTEGVRSNKVFEGEQTPSLQELSVFIQKAKNSNFTVMLRPIIDERSIVVAGKNEWRGTIRPRSVDAWFGSYATLLNAYAGIAEEHGADSLLIATELTSMEKHKERWRHLIEELRKTYRGKLSYSSNQSISKTMPWDVLDFIGVDAFFRLQTPRNNASADQMVGAMQKYVPAMTKDAQRLGKRLVFTEIGSTSQKNAHKRTWVWDHRTKVDLEDQRRFYRASCEVWKEHLAGMYFWAISSNIWLISDPQNDKGFSPLGKPAEEEIRDCFAQ